MMMSLPLVSVIIPTYNRDSVLKRAIESVLDQDYSAKEVVVVDDGSTKDSVRAVASWARKKEVRWLRHEGGRRGPSAARNTGARTSRGKYLVFLDSDDYFLSNRLSSHIEKLEGHREAAWAYSDYLRLEDKGLFTPPSPRPGFRPKGWILEPLGLMTERFWLPTMTLTFRRHAFEKVSGFDETISYAEDFDLWVRLALRYPIAYVPHTGSVLNDHKERFTYTIPNRIEQVIRILEKRVLTKAFFREHPETYQKFRRHRAFLLRQESELCHEQAYLRMREQRPLEARALLKRSIRYRLFRLKNYVYWVFTWLPPSMYATVRALKRRLVGSKKGTTA